jgi:hypothetical protein
MHRVFNLNSLPLFEFNVFVYTIDIVLYTYTIGASQCLILSLKLGQMDPECVSHIIMAVGLVATFVYTVCFNFTIGKNVHNSSVTLQSCSLLPVTHGPQSFMFFVASFMFRYCKFIMHMWVLMLSGD